MPVEVTKYRCVHKCGAKALGKESHMAAHEKHCWKNPENKTCKTCNNEVYGFDGSFAHRGCEIQALSDFLEKNHDHLKGQNFGHIRPVFNCENWNLPENENSQQLADTLEAEIGSDNMGTKHFPYHIPIPEKIKEDLFGNPIK